MLIAEARGILRYICLTCSKCTSARVRCYRVHDLTRFARDRGSIQDVQQNKTATCGDYVILAASCGRTSQLLT